MEAVTPLIHAFYNPQLQQSERESVHLRLLESLSTDACVEAADAHVAHCARALTSFSPASASPGLPPDPLVLHYSLHALENRIRTGFLSTPIATRKVLLDHLIEFTVGGFAWNVHVATTDSGNRTPLSAHVVSKAARTAVELGKREWVADSTCLFPCVVLALIDQNGHTAASLPRIFAGMVLLTILVDDALDVSRADVRASDRVALNKRIGSIADAVIAALEIGLRINGPGLPCSVPAAAVRTIGSVMRVAPSCASSAIEVLRRRTSGQECCDVVGTEALAVLAELYGESKVAVHGNWDVVLAHLSQLLEPVAMGETAQGDTEVFAFFRKRLTSYTGAVFSRSFAAEPGSVNMERALNGFMGATMRWAKEAPTAFPDALDVWIGLLETLEDEEVVVTELLKTAYGALARLCAEKCMFDSNALVLRSLEMDDDDDEAEEEASSSRPNVSPKIVELIAEMATRPAVYAGMASNLSSTEEEPVDEDGDVTTVSCDKYVEKCVEGLVAVARLLPTTVGVQSAELASRTISRPMSSSGDQAREAVFDKLTATTLARLVAPLLPCDSAPSRMLASAVASLFSQSPLCINSGNPGARPSESWFWKSKLDVGLMNTAAVLSPTMASSEWPNGPRMANSFVQVCRGIIEKGETSNTVSITTTLLLLSLGDACRATLFANEPPMPSSLVAGSQSIQVSAMGIVSTVRWVIESVSSNRVGGSGEVADSAWIPWMSSFQQYCGTVFSDFMSACSTPAAALDIRAVQVMLQGAILTHTMFTSLYTEGGGCKNVMWSAIGRELGVKMLNGLRELCNMPNISAPGTGALNEEDARLFLSTTTSLIGSLGCLMRVFRRHVAAEAPGLAQDMLTVGLEAAGRDRSPHLAQALLSVLREQVGDGFSKEKEHLVAPAVDLAVQSLSGDSDVTIGAIGVLVETLTRHWLMFWPGDVAMVAGAAPHGDASDAVRKVYFAAFGGLLTAVRHIDATVSREGMLGLERVEASRKLYSRTGAFRAIGGGPATIAACLGAMWSSPLVVDEACAVIWGVGKAEWNEFYGEGGSLMTAITNIQACSAQQARELMQAFGQPTDRPTFTRAIVALVNDLRFTSTLNKGPSL